MKQTKIWMFTLAALGLTACSNDDDDIVRNGQQQLLPLTITVTENPLLNPDAPSQVQSTRAAVTTTSTLTAFTLDYQYERSEELHKGCNAATKDGSGNWSAGSWPSDAGQNTRVDWYAHTDGTIVNQTNPYINFTVEELSTNQKDLLVASASGTKAETGGNLSFTFDHACTALRFYVKKSTNLNDYTLTVRNIKICNIVKQGQYYFASATKEAYWTPGTLRSDYTLYDGTDLALGSSEYIALDDTGAPYLFMIPQTLTAWDTSTTIASATAQTYLQIVCTLTKDAAEVYSGTAYIPFGTTLAAGMQHDVKINIGKNSLYNAPSTKIIN